MTKPHIDIIGSTEKVDFPELGLYKVPAKTDTGADSSAIWASDTRVTDEGLEFVLFGHGSQFYTGTPVLATTYRTTSVKNSFGEAEFRYKVRLLLRVGGRSVRAWFTLSERAGMRYPVLLGRRLLKNKFLVDVSRSQDGQKAAAPKRVLMLSASADNQQLADEIVKHMAKPATVIARTYEQLVFSVQTNKVVIRETVQGEDIADFDMVYFKSHRNNYEFAIAAAAYLGFKHVPFFDQELAGHVRYDKLTDSVLLALQGVAVPQSMCAKRVALEAQLDTAEKTLGFPLVCKELNADRGRKNFLLANKQAVLDVLAAAEPQDIFLLQAYVPNNGYLRVYIFGAEIGPVVARTPIANKDPQRAHLNKPAGGVNATLVPVQDVSSAACDIAMRASRLLNRQVAGVDVIQHIDTKQWMVLEVNNAPQLKTGGHVAEKQRALARFLDFELNR